MGAEHSSLDHGDGQDFHDDGTCDGGQDFHDDGTCDDGLTDVLHGHTSNGLEIVNQGDPLASHDPVALDPGQDPFHPSPTIHQDPSTDATDPTHQPVLANSQQESTIHPPGDLAQPTAGGIFSYDHHPDCDTAYPTDGHPANIPENFVCNEAETHGVWDDVRTCLQDEQADGVGFLERHYDCWADHFTDGGDIGGGDFGSSFGGGDFGFSF